MLRTGDEGYEAEVCAKIEAFLSSSSMRPTKMRGLNGLVTKSVAPDPSAASRPNSLEIAVSIMIGIEAVVVSRRKISHTANPSNSGIITSRTIKSNSRSRSRAVASTALAAALTR